MDPDPRDDCNRCDSLDGAGDPARPALHTRREVVGRGVKLAFVAPALSTLFAGQAYAANYSCYPQGHVCTDGGSDPEPCCAGLTCTGNPGTCEP